MTLAGGRKGRGVCAVVIGRPGGSGGGGRKRRAGWGHGPAAVSGAGMAAARGCPPAGSGDRALAELLLEFSRAQYRAKDGGGAAAKVERIERRCLELFGRDYRYSVISNAHGEVCAHYPRHIVLLERDAGRDPFESTVQVGKLQDLINRSKMARCRGRFVCPVILYKGKHICRSATLAGWGELYGRTGYNYIFSGPAGGAQHLPQHRHLGPRRGRRRVAVGERPPLPGPPCPGALSYYSRHGRDPAFTEAGPGRCFGSLHARHLQLLEWPGRPHDVFSVQGEPSKRYHLILPAFFRLLDTLHREGRAFAVVFRTFGTDLPRALRAVSCALAGQHPQFPALRHVALPVDLTPGQIRCSKREVVLTRGAERLATREDGRKLYDYFSSFEGIGGFQDHFDWWARNRFSSRGGKPLWIDPYDPSVHHIFIDDNIRLDDADTIVHPQVFSERGSSSPRRAPTSELYDVCLVQTDLLEAIADEDYFLRCVRRCEENYDRYLACTEKDTPSQRWDGQ
ncbi:myotubularin-related protein 14 [Gymnogyps californianus]|uniref:myotubularin-related protein 14 n=1 Tax=Gymnogyps californianus TaxID=33616 RepID=UPI0021C80DD6|nr:myotubularin-related protein 14 [Gymnogyps californianus]